MTKTRTISKLRQLADKEFFSTGEAAQFCNVSQQTIIRCFDKGQIEGFRVPGSKFRRIPRQGLIDFMKRNDIDTQVLETQTLSVYICSDSVEMIRAVQQVVEAHLGQSPVSVKQGIGGVLSGVTLLEERPRVWVMDAQAVKDNPVELCRFFKQRDDLKHMRIVVITPVEFARERVELLKAGADRVIRTPVDVEELSREIKALLK